MKKMDRIQDEFLHCSKPHMCIYVNEHVYIRMYVNTLYSTKIYVVHIQRYTPYRTHIQTYVHTCNMHIPVLWPVQGYHNQLPGFYLGGGGGGTLGMVPPLSRKVPPQNKNIQA